MYVLAQKKKAPEPTVFHIGTSGDTSPHFIAGITTCKNCMSKKMSYYKYVDDAKCECGQWQNEPLQH
jgi:hypothetical protein